MRIKNDGKMDMTQGNTVRNIFRFALPLMAASVIQQLFTLTDTMVLGIYGGNQSLAVLGACSWMNWFQVSLLTNLGQAACLVVSVRFGKKNGDAMKKAVGTVYFLTILFAFLLEPGVQLTVQPFLRIQNTPLEIFEDAVWYLRIVFMGTLFVLIYNILSSLLRATGDSRTSFTAITAAAVINLVLDVILVAGFGMGVKGAAAATAFSQIISAWICWRKIQNYPELCLRNLCIRADRTILREYADLCIPMIAQSFVISAGGTYVQGKVNGYGVSFAAGVSAAGKIFTLVETGAVALASACATFVGQNVGARQFERIRTAVRQLFGISLLMATMTGVFLRVFGQAVLEIFVQDEAVVYGVGYLNVYSIGVLSMYPMYYLRQTVQALGNAKIPLAAAVLQLCMRIWMAGYLTKWIGYEGIYYTSMAAWLVSLLLIGAIYPRQLKLCEQKYLEGCRH